MRYFIILLFPIICLTSCNDGDILEVALEFDKTLEFCDQSSTTYLVYDIKQNPNESLSLLFPRNTNNALIFAPTENNYESELTINGSTVRFNYRTYNGNPSNLLCQLVPDPATTIINDYESPSGRVITKTTFIDDDEDGIPTSVEDLDLDLDGNPETNPTDSDGDGIPDYKDEDDDNDNILTKFENPNYTEDDGLSMAQNSDGDTLPDYLDADDDGDGILTRYEDEDANLNPRDDFDEATVTPNIPARYLDPEANTSYQTDIDVLEVQFVPNKFRRSYTVDFKLIQIDLQILSTDEIDLGKYKYSAIIE